MSLDGVVEIVWHWIDENMHVDGDETKTPEKKNSSF